MDAGKIVPVKKDGTVARGDADIQSEAQAAVVDSEPTAVFAALATADCANLLGKPRE
jgi:hypothetical protein